MFGINSKDIFGAKAREDLDRLQRKLTEMLAKYRGLAQENADLQSQLASKNAANFSRQQYNDCKEEFVLKSAELLKALELSQQRVKDTEKQITVLHKTAETLTRENSASNKTAEYLTKQIAENGKIRDALAVDLKQQAAIKAATNSQLAKLIQQHDELTNSIAKLNTRQESLVKGTRFLEQTASRINRSEHPEQRAELLLHEVRRVLVEDIDCGANQINLEARPLILVVDVGMETTAFVQVSARLAMGSKADGITLELKGKAIGKVGVRHFEELLAGWLRDCFIAAHPRLTKLCSGSKGRDRFLPLAVRLFHLLCQKPPQGELEETVVIDSEPFRATLPLRSSELALVFRPIIGPDGTLLTTLRQLLSGTKRNAERIDRIICLGMYGRLPLLCEALADAFCRTVVTPNLMPIVSLTDEAVMTTPPATIKLKQSSPAITTTRSDSLLPKAQPRGVIREGFIIEDDVVTDSRTGLMWARNANLAMKMISWGAAQKVAINLSLGGYSNWRLPNKNELEALLKSGGKRPLAYFTDMGFTNIGNDQCYYWSSTSYANSSYDAWIVGMWGGGVLSDYKSVGLHYCVWPVRTGQ